MRSVFHYLRPLSLTEAVSWLDIKGSDTVVLAGGTDLMPIIRRGLLDCKYVMDVSRLEALKGFEVDGDRLSIGAGITYSEIAENHDLKQYAPVLVAAARCVGSEQVRNVGTLGGNVANASPAADSIPALMAHNTRVEIARGGALQVKPLPEVVIGAYNTSLHPGDLITRFLLEPLPAPYRAVYQRIVRRKAVSIARISLAGVGRLDDAGHMKDLRLSIGSVMPQPCRLEAAEKLLAGERPAERLFQEAASLVSMQMIRRSGVRPSTKYKKPAVEGLVVRSLFELFGECFCEGQCRCE